MTWPAKSAYSSADRQRCARRFRQQVWSPLHPERRIHRVYRCVNWRQCRSGDVQTQAHHVDYGRPYLVVWVCDSCHRRIEAKSLRIRVRWIYNYESLVRAVPVRHRKGEVITRKREEVPF